MRILLTFFILIFSLLSLDTIILASEKADKLEAMLANAKVDSSRMNILIKLAEEQREIFPEKALNSINQALELANKTEDKLRIAKYSELKGDIYEDIENYTEAISQFEKVKGIYRDILSANPGDTFIIKRLAQCLDDIGIIHDLNGEYTKAISCFNESLQLAKACGDKNGVANSYTNIGNIHDDKGDYSTALDYFLKALVIHEELNDKEGINTAYNNIGAIQYYIGNLDKALEYFNKILPYYKSKGDKQGVGIALNNIANVYSDKEDYMKSLEYYFKALRIDKELEDKNGMAISYVNIGETYAVLEEWDEAYQYLMESLKLYEEAGDKLGSVNAMNSLGYMFVNQKKNLEAIHFLQRSIETSKDLQANAERTEALSLIPEAYANMGDYKTAYSYMLQYSSANDSVYSEQMMERFAEMETRYESEKKEQEIQIQNLQIENQTRVNNKQRIIIYSVMAGIILFIAFSILLFSLFRAKKQANKLLAKRNEEIMMQKDQILQRNEEIQTQMEEIEFQRNKLEELSNILTEKNMDITDSIHYAKRLQEAIFPPDEKIAELLPDSFIFFKPKDIVSGDFFWVTKAHGRTYFSVCDCTGHGVPGAFMSIIGADALNSSIKEFNKVEPSDILLALSKSVSKRLHRSKNDDVKDGMDLTLCSLSNDNKLHYSGANNSIYIIRQGNDQLLVNNSIVEPVMNSEDKFLFELKPDRISIGSAVVDKSFRNNEVVVIPDDVVYLFSDGYADQFGGAMGKKLKYKVFKEILLAGCTETMDEQKNLLNISLKKWMNHDIPDDSENGIRYKKYEQIDDICVMGVKIGLSI